ncbi:MAG: TlpA disulfide reductase family protein, partial [Bacteroidota bacterium]
MKRSVILLFLFLPVQKILAQDNLTDCINYTFNHMDSLSGIGKNAFEEWKKCVLDKPIPVFTARTISGKAIGKDDFKGKVVVLNFWSINCLPCIAELPGLNKLVKKYKAKDVVIIAMTWEAAVKIKKEFLPKYQFDCAIVPDALRIIDKIAASGYPTTYIIDKKGIIKAA